MLTVPFKASLSYAWSLISGKKNIYSAVYETTKGEARHCRRVYGGVAAGPLYEQILPYTLKYHHKNWLVAEPVRGEKDQYKIHQHSYTTYTHDADTGLLPPPQFDPDYKVKALSGVYTREQAIFKILIQENDWKKSNSLPAKKQPFTKLAAKIPTVKK